MDIEISKLKELTIELLDKLEKEGIDKISLNEDLYWNIPSDQIYQPYNEPSQLDIGQLSDDYETLINAKENGFLVSYNLKNLSAILRYIADKKGYY